MATTVIKEKQPGSKAFFKDSFLLHKLHSLTGIVPIGAFLAFHLVVNAYALRGETEFNVAARAISYLPFVQIVEWVAIFIPILFHSIYGFFITAEMRLNTTTYQYGRNWLYAAQRVTGIVAIVYMVYHIWDTWGVKKYYELRGGQELGEQAISYASITYQFADLWYAAIYVIGITAAAFHLGNGLFNFSIRWGIAIGKEAQRIAAILGILVFLGLTGIGVLTAGKYYGVAQGWIDGGYEGKGAIRQQFASRDALVQFKAEQSRRAEKKVIEATGDSKLADPATMNK